MGRLLIEGRRSNFLAPAATFEEFLGSHGRGTWPMPSGSWPGPDGSPCAGYRVEEGHELEARRVVELRDTRSVTFSFFARASRPVRVVASVGTADELTRRSFLLSTAWARFSVSQRFCDPVDTVTTGLVVRSLIPEGEGELDLHFALFVLEEGCFPSSPIRQAFRAGGRLASEKHELGSSGTLVVLHDVYWEPADLVEEETPTVLELRYPGEPGAWLRLAYSGHEDGRVCLESGTGDRCVTRIPSRFRPTRLRLAATTIVWEGQHVWLYQDGHPWYEQRVEEALAPEHATAFCVGSSCVSERDGLFGCLHDSLIAYPYALSEDEVAARHYEAAPAHFPEFVQQHVDVSRPGTAAFGRDARVDDLVDATFRVVAGWAEIGPMADEAAYRDDLCRLLQMRTDLITRESISGPGPCDVIVHDPDGRSPLLRYELKIWGRNDFREVPEKPIKYMAEPESVAVMLMV